MVNVGFMAKKPVKTSLGVSSGYRTARFGHEGGARLVKGQRRIQVSSGYGLAYQDVALFWARGWHASPSKSLIQIIRGQTQNLNPVRRARSIFGWGTGCRLHFPDDARLCLTGAAGVGSPFVGAGATVNQYIYHCR